MVVGNFYKFLQIHAGNFNSASLLEVVKTIWDYWVLWSVYYSANLILGFMDALL
ncbi:hypothetical protein LYNGBM3L_71280 [Moorena producens 3L]|uniref:Uncharacterized protein n=1 Tax=Moorena producens 3L TaxID=489825 RepID=F4Y3L4_9CYAN|nr:hypothetical protein LYNGBM3L_71280 [Moorena producens 3L]